MSQIFTSTPMEAHIQALFLKAQVRVAEFMTSTNTFRLLLFGVLAWAIVIQFLRIASSRQQAGEAAVKIVYRIGMVFLALSLLNLAVPEVHWTSSAGEWGQMPGVHDDARYAQTLTGGQTSGLRGYLLVHAALNGLGQAIVVETARAIDDQSMAVDPMFVVKQLSRMESMSLGGDATSALEELILNCSKKGYVGIEGEDANLFDGFVTSPTPAPPGGDAVDCEAISANFRSLAMARGQQLVEQYSGAFPDKLREQLGNRFPTIIADDLLVNLAIQHAIARSLRNRSERLQRLAETSAIDRVKADRLEEVQADRMDFLSKLDAGAGDSKAGLASLQPMIPTARGFIQGVLALLFVFAAYSLGFGTWRFMYAWCMAEATLALYRPVAVLGYKLVEFFWRDGQVTRSFEIAARSPFALAAAQAVDGHLASIRSMYVAVEVGTFLAFVIGAMACFRPLASMASMAQGSMMRFMGAGPWMGMNPGWAGMSPASHSVPGLNPAAQLAGLPGYLPGGAAGQVVVVQPVSQSQQSLAVNGGGAPGTLMEPSVTSPTPGAWQQDPRPQLASNTEPEGRGAQPRPPRETDTDGRPA